MNGAITALELLADFIVQGESDNKIDYDLITRQKVDKMPKRSWHNHRKV